MDNVWYVYVTSITDTWAFFSGSKPAMHLHLLQCFLNWGASTHWGHKACQIFYKVNHQKHKLSTGTEVQLLCSSTVFINIILFNDNCNTQAKKKLFWFKELTYFNYFWQWVQDHILRNKGVRAAVNVENHWSNHIMWNVCSATSTTTTLPQWTAEDTTHKTT
jgi:hypothetical protein